MAALNAAKQAQSRASSLAKDLDSKRAQTNPHSPQLTLLEGLLAERGRTQRLPMAELQEAMAQLQVMKEVDRALGGGGIQSCLLETALDDLQTRVAAYLDPSAAGSLHLRLSATQEKKGKASGKAPGDQQLKEAIEMVVSAPECRWAPGPPLPGSAERRRAAAPRAGPVPGVCGVCGAPHGALV